MNPFLFRRIRGPVFLLCFALTALLAQWHILTFAQSWPLYLLTAGLLRLLDALLSLQFVGQAIGVPVRRPSLTFAVAELVVGVIALLMTTGVLWVGALVPVYAMWWPLLLVLLGVLLLVERLLDRRTYQGFGRGYGQAAGYPVYRRRRHGGGLVILVVILIGLGIASHHANPWWVANNGRDWNLGHDGWDFSELGWQGEAHENDVTLDQPLATDAVLTIDNARGDLQIAPSTDGQIHVQAHQVAHVRDADKDRAFADTRPVLSIHGGTAALTVPGHRGVEVNLVLTVPENVQCTLTNHHGDISISGLTRPVQVTQDHGDVVLDSVTGAVRVTMDHGDVHARALGSDVTIGGRADDVTLSDVKGKIALQGEFFGDTNIDGAAGPVEFHSNRTELSVPKMSGALSLDGENLRLNGPSGGLKVVTRSKDIEISGLSGTAQIRDSNSDVHLSAVQPLGAIVVTNDTGDIVLTVPAGASFHLHGQTGSDDSIESELPIPQTSNGDMRTIAGQVGAGGPQIELTTEHGDLSIHKSDQKGDQKNDQEHAAEQPERPEKPQRPEKVIHLKTPDDAPSPVVQ